MTNKPKRKYRWLKITGIILAMLILVPLIAIKVASDPLPDGQQGPEADALAQKMMASINHEAWQSTGAISWNFAGRNQHLWDKERHLVKVNWGENEVLVDINKLTGVAKKNGQKVEGAESEKLIKTAWANWCNDSFWLNPVSKAFDPGTSRKIIETKDGNKGVLVTYGSGGVTPGDSYLWLLDENGLPQSWRMWVNIIPIGGIETSWENWIDLPTGVKISTLHKSSLGLSLPITDVKADTSLLALTGGNDPFAELVNN